MQTILLCMAAVCAAYLSWQDWRYESVPLWAVLIWALICAVVAFYNPPYTSFVILSVVSIILLFYQLIKRQQLIAITDLCVMTSMSVWLSIETIPIFLTLTGIFGVITSYILNAKRFPLLPALFLSAALVKLFNKLGYFHEMLR